MGFELFSWGSEAPRGVGGGVFCVWVWHSCEGDREVIFLQKVQTLHPRVGLGGMEFWDAGPRWLPTIPSLSPRSIGVRNTLGDG